MTSSIKQSGAAFESQGSERNPRTKVLEFFSANETWRWCHYQNSPSHSVYWIIHLWNVFLFSDSLLIITSPITSLLHPSLAFYFSFRQGNLDQFSAPFVVEKATRQQGTFGVHVKVACNSKNNTQHNATRDPQARNLCRQVQIWWWAQARFLETKCETTERRRPSRCLRKGKNSSELIANVNLRNWPWMIPERIGRWASVRACDDDESWLCRKRKAKAV